jgi:hypothetical protein
MRRLTKEIGTTWNGYIASRLEIVMRARKRRGKVAVPMPSVIEDDAVAMARVCRYLLDEGRMSVRRMAQIMGRDIEDITDNL